MIKSTERLEVKVTKEVVNVTKPFKLKKFILS